MFNFHGVLPPQPDRVTLLPSAAELIAQRPSWFDELTLRDRYLKDRERLDRLGEIGAATLLENGADADTVFEIAELVIETQAVTDGLLTRNTAEFFADALRRAATASIIQAVLQPQGGSR